MSDEPRYFWVGFCFGAALTVLVFILTVAGTHAPTTEAVVTNSPAQHVNLTNNVGVRWIGHPMVTRANPNDIDTSWPSRYEFGVAANGLVVWRDITNATPEKP